jgi:exosome complex component RRP42
MMNLEKIVVSTEKRYILKNLRQGKRIDGRDLFEYRDFKIDVNIVKEAEGSADVSLGQSRVITGVKYELGPPFPDMPDKGVYTVMAELIPMASPIFESGPPDEQSIELARLIDRPIRSADTIQNDLLCIIPEKLVYILFIDVYVLNYSGNLIDCGAISSLAALISSKIPTSKIIDKETGVVEWDGGYFNTKKLIKNLPISVTFGKIEDVIFVDPNLTEELVMDGRITYAFNDDGKLVSLQKGGLATFSFEEIKSLARKAKDIGEKMRKKLDLRQY